MPKIHCRDPDRRSIALCGQDSPKVAKLSPFEFRKIGLASRCMNCDGALGYEELAAKARAGLLFKEPEFKAPIIPQCHVCGTRPNEDTVWVCGREDCPKAHWHEHVTDYWKPPRPK